MPGTFCEAMVTRKRGRAMLTIAEALHAGTVSSATGRASTVPSPGPASVIAAIATSRATGIAHLRAKRLSSAQVSTTGPAIHGISPSARAGATHRSSRTPASMALAIGVGMAAIKRPSAGNRPAAVMSSPQTTNAPTATGNPPSTAPVDTSNAAPGVDQAMVIGRRRRTLSRMATTPLARQSASSPDAACAWSAPTARSPARTTAKELAKPTTAVTTPASTGCNRRVMPRSPQCVPYTERVMLAP